MSGLEEETRSCCPLPHTRDGARPRPSAPGTTLCRGHVSALDRTLEELATFDVDADELIAAKTARHDTAPLTGNAEKPLPIDPRAADLRVDVRAILVSWVKLAAEERAVALPENTLKGLSGFLRRHHTWAVSQPWVDDYAGEVLDLGRKAHQLLNPSGRRRFTHKLMRCVEDIEGERCIGNMWALLTPEDPYAEASSLMICDKCEHEVPSSEWLSYGRRVRYREAA